MLGDIDGKLGNIDGALPSLWEGIYEYKMFGNIDGTAFVGSNEGFFEGCILGNFDFDLLRSKDGFSDFIKLGIMDWSGRSFVSSNEIGL